MKRLPVVSALFLLLLASEARAQLYVQTVSPGAYVPLANIPGAQNITPFTLSDDDEGSATVPIPFTFTYLGQPYTEARVAVNGYVVFGQNTDFGSFVNEPIGSSFGADNVIAVWWDDLVVPGTDGYSSYGTIGAAPNRIFVIELREWEHYSLGNVADGNWQVWLYEGATGRFEVRVDGELDATEGYSATSGWEGPNGAPSGTFLACSSGADCDHLDYATLLGNVYAVEQAQGPELVGSVGVFPRGALPGQSATGQVTLRNLGTQSVTNVESELYLSADAQLGGTDLLAGTFTVPQLLAGDVPVTVTATVSVPPGAQPRDWNLLLSVDSNDQVAEVTEGNNVAPAAARFATAYDVAAFDVSVPVGANPGDTLSVDVELANQGLVFTGAVTVRVHASRNRAYEATDPVVGTTTVNLGGAASEIFSLDLTLPGLPPASYYPVLRVDPDDSIIEYDDTDNVLVGAATFPVGPELRITQLTSPGGADPGQPITFTVTVQNDGVPYAGVVPIRFIASPDPIYDVNDPIIGATTLALAGFGVETLPATVTLPSLPAGTYYPIAILDPDDVIAEANDFNNTAVSTDVFTSGPDFVVADIEGPTQATPGQAMMVTTTIGSPGAPYTGQVAYRLFLSADQTYDGGDRVVGQYDVSFAGEAAIADPRTPVFPPELPPTGHYLIAVVDPTASIGEANEGNNLLVDDQRIGSGTDLRIYSVDFDPSVARAGDQVTVTFTLSAEGSPYSGPVQYRISLSDDSYPDPNDIPLLDGAVVVNGTVDHAITATITVGAMIPPDDYEFIVEADPDDLVTEPSETNNWDNSFFDIDIQGPNLIVSSIVAGPQAFVGIPYRVELTITNSDLADAASFRYAYYYTTNGLLRPPDGTELLTGSTGALAAGQTRAVVDMIDIPPQPAPSRFVQLGVIVDVDDAVLESDEVDNVTFLPGQIQILVPVPDLWVRIDDAPLDAAAGEDLAITRTIQNLGVADSAPFTYSYYLSANAEISFADDILIGSFTNQLMLADYDLAIDVLNVPATVPPGLYQLGLVADPANTLLETDETNNVALGPEVRVHPAALAVHTDQLPTAVLGAPYSAQLFARGPTVDRTWSITGGVLPPGLALDQLAGTISGTPAEEGLYPFTARVTAGNAYAEREISLRVRGATVPIEILSATLPYAIAGRPYQAELVAAGGATPYTWGVRSTPPPGLTVTATGGIGGTPEQASSYLLSVVVTDAQGNAATRDVVLNVIRPDQTVSITQSPLPEATLGVEYCPSDPIRLYASGGLPEYTWSVLSDLPLGMTLSMTGELCGAPTETGDFPLLLRVQDSAGVFDTSLFNLRVRAASELTVTVTSLQDARLGEMYVAKLTARQGVEPYRWRLFDGALPDGLELSADGTVSGTPTMAESAVFAVEVTDAAMQVRLQPLSLLVVESVDGGGCGCSASRRSENGSPLILVLLLGLILARRAICGPSVSSCGEVE